MQQPGAFYLDGPLNIAHRGARDVAPENTMAAFAAAIDAQADGIELDVSRCGTGEIVVMHDDTVDRTTDGSGTVARLGWAAIMELDAGGWFAPEFVGERVPTLAEVLDLVGGRLRVNIEVKHKAQRHDGIEEEIAAMVAQRGLGSSIIISSFDPVILRRFKQVAPQLATGLLYSANMPFFLSRGWARHLMPTDAVHPHHAMVSDRYVRTMRRERRRVNAWTVNEDDDMRRMIALRVDGIITDHPAHLHELLLEAQAART